MANIQSGKAYKLTNAKGGTVLDLSGGQERGPITGYSPNGGDNQKVCTLCHDKLHKNGV